MGDNPYAFGLGKRAAYNFGLGKRAQSYTFGLGRKRDPYAFGLGKRADPAYAFGLGKRDPVSLPDNLRMWFSTWLRKLEATYGALEVTKRDDSVVV